MEDLFNTIADAIKPNEMYNREIEILSKFSPEFVQLCKINPIVYEPFSYYSTTSVFYDLHIQ